MRMKKPKRSLFARQSLFEPFEEVRQADNRHTLELFQSQKMTIAGHDEIRISSKGAFQDSVVWFIFQDVNVRTRPENCGCLGD